MGAGDATEANRPPIPVGGTIVAAARAAKSDPWRILAAAIVVSVVTAVLDVVANDLVDKTDLPLVLVTSISATGAATFGDVFLSGFLCRIVGDAEHGTLASQRPTIRQVAADLPWRRLIGADLMVALLVIIGLVALIIPGLIVITLFAVTGPVIEIERRPVFAALRRSAVLARQHFWTVVLLGTLPLLLSDLLESQVPRPDRPGAILTFIARPVYRRGPRAGSDRPAPGRALLPAACRGPSARGRASLRRACCARPPPLPRSAQPGRIRPAW